MPDVRKRVLRILAAHTDGVFAAAVDKRYARDWWTPTRLGNHAFAQTAALGVLRAIKADEQPAIIHDQGRMSQSDESVFESYLLYKQFDFAFAHNVRHLHIPKPPHSVPSTGHPGIWAADCVAGAFCHKHQADDARYADVLRPVRQGGMDVLEPATPRYFQLDMSSSRPFMATGSHGLTRRLAMSR